MHAAERPALSSQGHSGAFSQYVSPSAIDMHCTDIFIAHESKSDDSRLGELITKTLDALKPDENADISQEKRQEQRRLEELFVTAQTADVSIKIDYAVS